MIEARAHRDSGGVPQGWRVERPLMSLQAIVEHGGDAAEM